MNIPAIQDYMRQQKIDGWLLYDFRGSNLIFARLLGGQRHTTRRAAFFIPAAGEPRLLVQGLDANQFENLPYKQERYLGWQDFRDWLSATLGSGRRIAMEYSPGAALPLVSIADAGTIELVRSLGADVVSSANLIQVAIAIWSDEALANHLIASKKVDAIKDEAFGIIRSALAADQSIDEYQVQQFIMRRFKDEGLETYDPPIIGVNAHAGDPHFEVSATDPAPIRKGDWVLIDLWARIPGDHNIFSDITWTGYCGRQVPAKHREVFDIVRRARDKSLQWAKFAWDQKQPVQGWQLDQAAYDTIADAGYKKYIKHRTGHSLSTGPTAHGVGMNLDNLETHDTREMLPGIGFTIEPGIYLPEFGVRNEIDVYVDPKKGPIVTSGSQDEPILMG